MSDIHCSRLPHSGRRWYCVTFWPTNGAGWWRRSQKKKNPSFFAWRFGYYLHSIFQRRPLVEGRSPAASCFCPSVGSTSLTGISWLRVASCVLRRWLNGRPAGWLPVHRRTATEEQYANEPGGLIITKCSEQRGREIFSGQQIPSSEFHPSRLFI